MIPEVEAARWHKAIMYQVQLFWQKFRESPHILMSHDLYEMLYRDDHYRDSFRLYKGLRYCNCPCTIVHDWPEWEEKVRFFVGYEGGLE